MGGPNGGDGGRGGSIYAIADRNINTLVDYRYTRKFIGKRGENALAFAPRQFAGAVFETMAQANGFKHRGGAGQGFATGPAANQERHGNVFQRRKLGEQMVVWSTS